MSAWNPELAVINEYKEVMFNGLRHSFPGLKPDELSSAIDWSVYNRLYNGKASLDNNYTKKRIDGTVLDILKYIETLQPIITSSGVLFKQHKQADNPLSRMIQGFLKKRKEYKKMMFKYPRGSEAFQRYNLFQLLEKLNANATYGLLGAATALFYNIYVAQSITRQGRSYISCSITLFESLLANNIKFNSLNEVITFIDNIVKEKRMTIDEGILDRNITVEECFFKVMNTADMSIWVPTENEMKLVWEYLIGLSQEDINRIYYKNNLYEFCDNKAITDLIINTLSALKVPFTDPNNPPAEIQEYLDILTELIKEYVYYPHFYIDKLDRIEYMQRDVTAIVDTDSTMVSLDAWYRFVLSKVHDIDMPIQHEKFDMCDIVWPDEFGDMPKKVMCEIVEPEMDYDFFTEEFIEMKRYIEPCKIVPQESMMCSIINMMGYIGSQLVQDYLLEYSKLTGSYEEGTKCRMIMKSEYLFYKLLLTENRRNYASWIFSQEGNRVPEEAALNIAGLKIDKSNMQTDIKKEFKKILVEDIMKTDNIDQIKLMKKMVFLENKIYQAIMNKRTEYYTPDNVAPINSYSKNPLEVNGVIACMIFNEMKEDYQQPINLEERNAIIKIKIDVNKKNVEKIKDLYPEAYQKLVGLLNHPTLGKKVKVLGLPLDAPVPDWVLPFVNFKEIISDSLKNFPLESIGLQRLDNDMVNYSNIVTFG